MKIYEALQALLIDNKVNFHSMEHPPTFTSEQSAKYRGEALSTGAKAIVYKIEKKFYLFVMPADLKIDTRKIKAYFKAKGLKAKKSRFATPEELLALTGLVPGSVPPFGQPILPFPLFVDAAIMKNEKVAFNAGSLTNSIIMSRESYLAVAKPEIFDFTV